jgi:hypothetical protein
MLSKAELAAWPRWVYLRLNGFHALEQLNLRLAAGFIRG